VGVKWPRDKGLHTRVPPKERREKAGDTKSNAVGRENQGGGSKDGKRTGDHGVRG